MLFLDGKVQKQIKGKAETMQIIFYLLFKMNTYNASQINIIVSPNKFLCV